MGRFSDDKIWVMDRHTKKSGILLQIEKAPEANNGVLTCYVFSLVDAVARLSFTNPSGILTIEK